MSITIEELESERVKLRKDFDDLKDKIGKVEIDLGTMKANLNALNGALQFSTNLIFTKYSDIIASESKLSMDLGK